MPLERTADRLKRILVLVPWVIANEGATVSEVCERFGLTPAELVADLDLLMMCGLPPFQPDTLIEAFIDEDRVVIGMGADALARPPRLTRSEALSLLVMGRAVAALPGLEEAGPLRSALDKLARAVVPADAADAEDVADRIAVSLGSAGAEQVAGLRDAARDRRRLRIEYYSAGRGKMSAREIDPVLVFGSMGYWYVLAFDHHSGEQRTFRVDRIRAFAPTGATFEAIAFEPPDAAGPLFTPSEGDVEVTIELGPRGAWVAEVVPYERSGPVPGGWTRLGLRTPHMTWLVRLLMSAGEDARAVSPPELIEGVRSAAARALERYAG